MRHLLLAALFLGGLACLGSPVRAADTAAAGDAGAAATAPLDTVYLKDGSVLRGQVVDYRKDTVTLMANGVKRKLDSSLVARIVFAGADSGSSAQAPAAEGSQAAQAPASPYAGLAREYQVPVSEVLWIKNQGIGDKDLTRVLYIAAGAQVTPAAVVKLYQAGMTWREISRHFGLDPALYCAPVAYDVYWPALGLAWWDFTWRRPYYGWHADWDGDWGWGYRHPYWGWRAGWRGGWHHDWR